MRRYQPLALALVLLITFFAGGLIISTTMLHQPLLAQSEPSPVHDTQQAAANPSFLLGNPYAIADIAEEATPGVVLITVEWPVPETAPQPRDPFSFFFDFFGTPMPPSQRGPAISNGSGFLIDPDGYIFTNQHVVGDPGQGQTVTVRLHPSSSTDLELEAEIVGSDYELDLAILKLKDVPKELQGKLPALKMGDSDRSRPGEWVIAIGNPYGYEHTVTVGALSAKGREIQIFDQERRQTKIYRDLLQTDAAINRGNSGGPLINIEGEVIGINTAVQASGQGIGFAIPINSALAVRDELIETGSVSREADRTESLDWTTEVVQVVLGRDVANANRALLGVSIYDIDEAIAEQLELPEAKGALVENVVAGSAAHRAGIRPNDIIVRFDDVEVETVDDLVNAVAAKRPGQVVVVTLLRYQVVTNPSSAV